MFYCSGSQTVFTHKTKCQAIKVGFIKPCNSRTLFKLLTFGRKEKVSNILNER